MLADRFWLCGLVCTSFVSMSVAQDPFATTVVDFQQGPGSGIFNTAAILGGPRGLGFGNGSLDVLSLGAGGQVTVSFDVTITDGPGTDFIVFENGFESVGGVFAEVAFVEVSTDGVVFARMPTTYAGAVGPLPAFGATAYGTFSGFVGGVPVLANIDNNLIDPLDPVVSGGAAFDLQALAQHPLVLAGQVNLDTIHYIRIVDARAGIDMDSQGTLVWDNGGATGSADIDALAVVQHTLNQDPSGPRASLYRDGIGRIHLVLADPDGRSDLDLSSLQISVNMRTMTRTQLRRWFSMELISDDVYHLTSGLLGIRSSSHLARFRGVLSVSVRDRAGAFSADQLILGVAP